MPKANDTQAATYTNDPANNPIDAFRLAVGDTDCRDAWLTDKEIRYFRTQYPDSEQLAQVEGARAILAKVASRIDFKHGSISKTASQLFEHYERLVERLEGEAAISGVVPEVLGRTLAEKDEADSDTGLVQPAFKKGVHDNPRAGPTESSEPPESFTI